MVSVAGQAVPNVTFSVCTLAAEGGAQRRWRTHRQPKRVQLEAVTVELG